MVDESLGLRIRGSGVRISPSAPALRPAIEGFLAVSAFVLSAVSCCKALQASSSEFNELPDAAIHSMQHGRNTTSLSSFSPFEVFEIPHEHCRASTRFSPEERETYGHNGDRSHRRRTLRGI